MNNVSSEQESVTGNNGELQQIRAVMDNDIQARKQLEATVEECLARMQEVEDEVERLRSRLENADGKPQKVSEIVRQANRLRDGRPAVKLTYRDIVGATGCSERYAYDLMDRLPTEYDWFLTPDEMKQYGSLEIDNNNERRLGVDFEGVHSSGCPLNKFNNRNGSVTPE